MFGFGGSSWDKSCVILGQGVLSSPPTLVADASSMTENVLFPQSIAVEVGYEEN